MFVSFLTAFSFPIVFQPGRNSVLGLWRYMDSDETAWVAHRSFRYIAVTVRPPSSSSPLTHSLTHSLLVTLHCIQVSCMDVILYLLACLCTMITHSLTHPSLPHSLGHPHVCTLLPLPPLQVAMLVLALGVALLVDDLGIMFSFVGATGATMVSFILPGAAYYHMHAEPDLPFWQQEPLTVAAYCLFLAGCVFAPMGVAFLFIN
jgi:hypothetical protein